MTWLERLDGAARRVARDTFDWTWPALYGVSVGSSAWWLRHPSEVAALGNNRLDMPTRSGALVWVALAVAVSLAVYLVGHVLARRVSGQWLGHTFTQKLNRWLLPCLSGPPLAAILQDGIEQKRALLCVALVVLIAVLWALPFYQLDWPPRWRLPWTESPTPVPAESRVRKWLPRILTITALGSLWIGYGLFFSRLSIINHHNLYTATFDLGLYDNIFYQSLRGKPLGCSFLANNYHGAAHFDPILVLLAPLYLFYPRAESLLVIQSFWMGAGLFPVYLIARRLLECRWQALVLASCWVLYPALQGANMYDFHSLSLAAPVLVWLLWFLRIESGWGYWVTFALTLLIREDLPLLLCFIAFAAIRQGTPFGVRSGWLSILISLAYFVLVKAFLMGAPQKALTGTQTYSFAYYYAELIPGGGGLREMFSSLLTNPAFVLQLGSSEGKVLFVLLLFVPLGFLPFFARSGRLALFYGFFFCLLATREPVYSIYFQYAVVLFSVGFALTPEGLTRLTRAEWLKSAGVSGQRLQRVLVAGLWLTTALLCLKFGGLVPNDAFRGGFNPPRRQLDERARARYEWVERTTASIPPEAKVGATRRLGPHISNRMKAYDYPGTRDYDYLFVDRTQLEAKGEQAHERYIKDNHFVVQDRRDNLILYRKAKP
jgi:uncharacterized membrane protein